MTLQHGYRGRNFESSEHWRSWLSHHTFTTMYRRLRSGILWYVEYETRDLECGHLGTRWYIFLVGGILVVRRPRCTYSRSTVGVDSDRKTGRGVSRYKHSLRVMVDLWWLTGDNYGVPCLISGSTRNGLKDWVFNILYYFTNKIPWPKIPEKNTSLSIGLFFSL